MRDPQPGRDESREHRFQLLVESVVDYAIFMLGPDGTVLTWNIGAEPIKGYPATEVIGRHFQIFLTAQAISYANQTQQQVGDADTGR